MNEKPNKEHPDCMFMEQTSPNVVQLILLASKWERKDTIGETKPVTWRGWWGGGRIKHNAEGPHSTQQSVIHQWHQGGTESMWLNWRSVAGYIRFSYMWVQQEMFESVLTHLIPGYESSVFRPLSQWARPGPPWTASSFYKKQWGGGCWVKAPGENKEKEGFPVISPCWSDCAWRDVQILAQNRE